MYELIIIGAGPAGLAAAVESYKQGLRKILIIERDNELGGVLNQCIHNGFGLHYFKEELTGPEFSGRFIEMLKETSVEVLSNAMVLEINKDKEVFVSCIEGYKKLQTQSIILSMGCRERSRGAIGTPGSRCAGVYPAGTAQRYMNMDGFCVGKRVVILGSGDIGLIMARRMTLEGAKVLACIEVNPVSSGLARNIKQCLQDFNIPLYLSHTISDIRGKDRVQQVEISKVDNHFQPIKGTEFTIDCDTVLLAVGLIPENEISKAAGIKLDNRTKGPIVNEAMETSIEGIFACGNVVHVHDLVDNVAIEASRAAKGAANYVLHKPQFEKIIQVKNIPNVTYTVPQFIRLPQNDKLVEISFRVNKAFGKCKIEVLDNNEEVISSYPRNYITPGELQKISVPTLFLNKITDYISVRVLED